MPPSEGTLILALVICTEILCNCAVLDIHDERDLFPPRELTLDQSSSNSTARASGGNVETILERYNPDDLQIDCNELRSKRYISDGFCTSSKPITEVVCAGECLPVRLLPWYADYVKVWGRGKTQEWRCVNDVERLKRVHLRCEDGKTRTYRIKTVRSCKCKKYSKGHNSSKLDRKKRRRRQRKRDVSND
ncbi:sclerostin domain-containing protein 1-like [Glandiceps talaboti]